MPTNLEKNGDKMILFLAFILTLLFSSNFIYAIEIEVDSKITHVTVYPNYALINRTANIILEKGKHNIIFPNIIPEVDRDALRVSAAGDAEVKLFGALLREKFLEEVPSERIRNLIEQIQTLEDEIKRQQDLKNLLLEEKDFLDSIRLFAKEQLPKDLITKMPTPQELDDMLTFLGRELRENYSAIMECEQKTRDLNNKVEALRKELAKISVPAEKLKRSIIVDLEVLKAGNLDLSVFLLVRNASWWPTYDARANFEKSSIELIYFGTIQQITGEDWPDVEVSLSTAKPAISGRIPDIDPWFLRPYQPPIPAYKQERLFPRVAEESLGAAAEPKAVPEYARVEEKGIAMVYKLPQNADIKADGSEHKLPIATQELKADFEYSTYPRAIPFAYLNCQVANAKDLSLLAGQVNIFLEGSFSGSSSIDTIGPGEEFNIYLGVDETVKVKREQVEKKVDETRFGGAPSKTKSTTFKYKLAVENYKSKKIKVNLFEAMPVSEDDRIKVSIHHVNLEPSTKDWEDKKGVWLWRLELEPGERKEIFYSFKIDHPREMQIEGL